MAGDSSADGVLTTSDIKKQIQRYVNCLTDSSKITRKRGLQELRKETITRKLGGTILQEITPDVLKPVLKCFSDPSEINRELSINLVIDYFSALPNPQTALAYIMPCLVLRLGQENIVEPSEELRQLLVESLLDLTIEMCGKNIAGFLDETIQVLKRTITDPFGNVIKASCKVACSLARCIPEHFHMQSESLIVPLMQTITHQHSKVRVAVIEATADVIQFGSGKNVDDVISHLAQRLFDQSLQVRKCVTKVVGRWLLELPDRYSFFYKFIPLILTSLSDEIPEIREEATELWNAAGILYEKENENDFKDKMDFEAALPSLYPDNVTRPCLGCRELVQRNLSKLMPAIIRDLGDWVPETRVKTSQLLHTLLLHAEEYTTQHMQPLIQALLRACVDNEKEVFDNAMKSAKLIGAFVEPEVFCKLVLQAVQDHAAVNASALEILAATITGCSAEVLGDKIYDIIKTISDPDVCQVSEKADYHAGLLHCVQAIMATCCGQVETIGLQLFIVVITVLALSASEEICVEAVDTLSGISSALKIPGGIDELYAMYAKQVIDSMSGSYESWTKYSVNQLIFDTLITRAGSVVGQLLKEVLPILQANFKPEKDPEIRLKFFTLLSKLLLNTGMDYDLNKNLKPQQVRTIITEMIVPNLVWKAGRTAAAVRTIAMSSLWALIKSGSVHPDVATSLLPEPLLPLLSSMLEDDVKTTRNITANVLTKLFAMCGTRLNTDSVLHKVYMDLLKRMDDSSDEIRLIVAKTWSAFFTCFGADYDISLYRAHMEEMFSGLLIHMDDPDTKIQLAVLDVLKQGGQVCPGILLKEIDKVKHKHRTPHYCEQLIQFLQNLPPSKS